MMMVSPVDWIQIETEYRADLKSIRQIARDLKTSESAIRRRAKKCGWVRDGQRVKREKVKAGLAGRPDPGSTNQPEAVAAAIDEAAIEDIRDMRTGLENARLALEIANKALRTMSANEDFVHLAVQDAKNLKVLTEVSRYNVELIRRIRGLDEPDRAPTEFLADEDEKIIERYLDAQSG